MATKRSAKLTGDNFYFTDAQDLCYNLFMETFTSLFSRLTKTGLDVLILRVGLGLVFLYAGSAALQDPMSWVGFIPQFVEYVVPRETFLMFHSYFEILLGAVLIGGKWLKVASVLAFLSFFLLLITFGIDDVTFRDFGLAAMSLALFVSVVYKK